MCTPQIFLLWAATGLLCGRGLRQVKFWHGRDGGEVCRTSQWLQQSRWNLLTGPHCRISTPRQTWSGPGDRCSPPCGCRDWGMSLHVATCSWSLLKYITIHFYSPSATLLSLHIIGRSCSWKWVCMLGAMQRTGKCVRLNPEESCSTYKSYEGLGIRVAGFSLQHGYHSNPTTPKLQHTSNQEQYDQCGNSTE